MRPASSGAAVQRPASSRLGTPRVSTPRRPVASGVENRRPGSSRLATPRLATPRQTSAAPATLEADSIQKVQETQQAQLNRRGNAQVQKDLQDANRMFDPAKERDWEQKYKFFSGQHMKKHFRVYARARHDPFNKDPSWGKGVISNVAAECARQGKSPEALFSGIDLTGDGTLNRPELKRVICSVLPTMSDLEVTSLFDYIDQDGSGEVNVGEFCEVLRKGNHEPVDEVAKERWRNPIHRMKRIAPARVEGWDHLTGPCDYTRHDDLCDIKAKEIMDRLGSQLMKNPKALRHLRNTPKYATFGGGCDINRFHAADWRKYKATLPNSEDGVITSARITDLPDPGPDVRPGFLCDPRKMNAQAASGFHCIRQLTASKPLKAGPELDISAEAD